MIQILNVLNNASENRSICSTNFLFARLVDIYQTHGCILPCKSAKRLVFVYNIIAHQSLAKNSSQRFCSCIYKFTLF